MTFDRIDRKFLKLMSKQTCGTCHGAGWEQLSPNPAEPLYQVCTECHNPEKKHAPDDI
jgi:mono/diheme cytochrome c family protein